MRWKRALAALVAAAGFAAGDVGAGERTPTGMGEVEGAAELDAEVKGTVVDDAGEPVEAARIELVDGLIEDGTPEDPDDGELSGSGTDRHDSVARTFTTADGSFRLEGIEPGLYRLRVRAVGFRPASRDVRLTGSVSESVTVELEPQPLALAAIAVRAPESGTAGFTTRAGRAPMALDAEAIRAMPSAGEPDPLRAVETLPGVVSTTDVTASFNVRGGSADQNRILLDGIPVFGPFHLGGLFSVFNADLVDRTTLHAGDVPTRFQGGVSSVLEVDSDPGPGDLQVDAGLSLLSTRAAVAGGASGEDLPGLGDLNWRLSARRSYLDVVTAPLTEIPYRFHDVQGIAEAETAGGGVLTLVGYTGGDRLDMGNMDPEERSLRTLWEWGNHLVGAGWEAHTEEGEVEVRAGYTRFASGLGFLDFEDTEFGSRVDQALVRMDYRRSLGSGWSVEGGVASDRMTHENRGKTGGVPVVEGEGSGWMAGAHGTVRWRAPARWVVELGGRMDRWTPPNGEAVRVAAPRAAVKRFFAQGRGALNVSAGRHGQFHHSLRDEALPVGIDFWTLTGEGVPPLVADQAALGVEGWLGDGWFTSAEAYLRSMDGVVMLNPADDPNDPHDDVLEGSGTARGLDVLLRRDAGRLRGTLALSWLRAERTFPDPRAGRAHDREVTFPPAFDRRADVDLNVRFPLVAGWTGSVRWHAGSGQPYTRPEGTHLYLTPRQSRGGRWVWPNDPGVEAGYGSRAVVLGERNAERYPTYHRMDVGLRRTFERSWGTLAPYLDVLNVYNQRNVLFYFYDYDADPPVRSGMSMIPFLPSLGLEVSF